MAQQGTNWVFTLNNPQDNDIPRAWPVKYAIWQREKGTNGTEHLQGYIILNSRKRLGGMKAIDGRAHWELRRGTHDQAKEYCSKDETRVDGPWTFGEEPKPGKRTDLEEVAGLVAAGSTPRQLANSHPAQFMRLHRGITALRMYLTKPRCEKTEVVVIYGPTGVGKSRYAFDNYYGAYWKPPCSSWWDAYDGEHDVVIDEFYGWLPWSEVLRLCDRYPCLVQTKGGMVQFNSKRIIFLSNKPPDQWYDPAKHSYDVLERRIDVLAEMTAGGKMRFIKGALVNEDPDFEIALAGADLPDPPLPVTASGTVILPDSQ